MRRRADAQRRVSRERRIRATRNLTGRSIADLSGKQFEIRTHIRPVRRIGRITGQPPRTMRTPKHPVTRWHERARIPRRVKPRIEEICGTEPDADTRQKPRQRPQRPARWREIRPGDGLLTEARLWARTPTERRIVVWRGIGPDLSRPCSAFRWEVPNRLRPFQRRLRSASRFGA